MNSTVFPAEVLPVQFMVNFSFLNRMDGAAYFGVCAVTDVISSMETESSVTPALEISDAMPSISHPRRVAFSGLDEVGFFGMLALFLRA